MLVERSVYEDKNFQDKLKDAATSMKVGSVWNPDVYKRQVRVRVVAVRASLLRVELDIHRGMEALLVGHVDRTRVV